MSPSYLLNMKIISLKEIFVKIKVKEILERLTVKVNILIFILVLFAVYAIIQIKFECAFWIGSSIHANEWNEIITNLSYSYLAAYIFFLLTVTLPHITMKSKINKALISKINTIISNYEACLESVLPLTQTLQEGFTKEDAINMFRDISYKSPCRLSSIGQNVDIATYIKIKHEENQELASQLLEYKPWLSSISMAQIEGIRNSDLSKVIIVLTRPTLISYLDNGDSRGKLASSVFDLWNHSKQIKMSLS